MNPFWINKNAVSGHLIYFNTLKKIGFGTNACDRSVVKVKGTLHIKLKGYKSNFLSYYRIGYFQIVFTKLNSTYFQKYIHKFNIKGNIKKFCVCLKSNQFCTECLIIQGNKL